jgi:hypothetical protein
MIPGLFLALLPSWLNGQDVEFTASAKTNVQTGEQFRVVYSLNQQASDFSGPPFENFRVLSGPNQSTNQSYQIVNGKVSQSFTVTYTYYVQAVKEGVFSFAPATATIKGKRYESNGLQITVTQGAAASPGNQPAEDQAIQQTSTGIRKDDVFIKASADKQNPYQGEQVIVTYKIFTTVPISQINITKLSSFPGFWYTNLINDNDPLKQYTEKVNGRDYVVADLRRIALFPQRSGEIVIEPMEMQCLAQVKTDRSNRTRDPFFDSFFDDPFFNRAYENVEMDLESNTLKINVKSLPEDGKPIGFAGAVGSFTLTSEIDRTSLKSNEPLSMKVTVSGKGNIELIEGFNVNFPPDFESYDPKITSDLNKTNAGVSGIKVFEYLTIPRNPGQFNLKPLVFSFFDPLKKTYITLETPSYEIRVGKGEESAEGVTYSGVSQKNIQFIGSDIRHIKTHVIALSPLGSSFFGSGAFYMWLLAPLVLATAFILILRYNRRRRGNTVLMKTIRATKVARKNLKKAGEYLEAGKGEEFFEEISRALWGYISNKFDIPLAELSIDNVSQRLATKHIGEESIGQLTEVLNKCEYARFAPGDESRNMRETYSSAMDIISRIESELK